MNSGADPGPPLRHPSGRSQSATGAYVLSLVSNVIVGYLTIFPLVMLALALESTLSFSPSWAGSSFGVDEEEAPYLVVLALILLLPLVSGFLLSNIFIRRRTALSRLKYWSIAGAELVLPVVASILVSALWDVDPLAIF